MPNVAERLVQFRTVRGPLRRGATTRAPKQMRHHIPSPIFPSHAPKFSFTMAAWPPRLFARPPQPPPSTRLMHGPNLFVGGARGDVTGLLQQLHEAFPILLRGPLCILVLLFGLGQQAVEDASSSGAPHKEVGSGMAEGSTLLVALQSMAGQPSGVDHKYDRNRLTSL